jgi:hypothetical protein
MVEPGDAAPAAVRAPYLFRAQNLVGAIAFGTVRLALARKWIVDP